MKPDADSDRVALDAASIVVHPHAIARREPALNDEAVRIVGLTRRLYAVMPCRAAVAAMVDDVPAEAGARPSTPRAASIPFRKSEITRGFGDARPLRMAGDGRWVKRAGGDGPPPMEEAT